ncbi:MAG: PilN domain-containing protein, partial [Thermoanaerobaculia bacterium]|nr:PilN domain-containing protein [Thermoanaerobaculia bacterium]
AEGKRPIISRKAKQPLLQISEANAANWALGGVCLLGVLAVAGWYFWLNAKIDRKQNEINVAQREVDELQQVIKEVQEYEAKLKELNRKVEVITTLKDNQRGPVVIMDEVSRALPELMWLTNLDVTPTNINFRGTAFNMSAVANFIDNLDRVEAFREPVLQDTSRGRSGRNSTTEIYDFRLTLAYSFKKEPAATATATGAAATAAAPPGGAIATAQAARTANAQGLE